MKLQCKWNEKMSFTAEAGSLRAEMDAKRPLGDERAMTPKQLLLAGICGCTAMDVVSLLKKHKQTIRSFVVDADAPQTEGQHPAVFTGVSLEFRLEGDIDPAQALEAVRLSQTLYCGVGAMVAAKVPVTYTVVVNGKAVGQGKADFG